MATKLGGAALVGAAIFLAAVATGLVGAGLNLIIEALAEIADLDPAARLWIAAGAGVACALAWWWLRPLPAVNTALSLGTPLPLGRTVLDALAQILFVGAGASLGREQAPRQVAAAVGDKIAARLHPDMRARIVAGAAGAGLAAVYNTPCAGAIFALETLPLKRDKSFIAIATVMSFIATFIARPITGAEAFYLVPPEKLTLALGHGLGGAMSRDTLSTLATRQGLAQVAGLLVFLLALGLVCAVVGVGFRRLLLHRPHIPNRALTVSIPAVLVATVLVDLWLGDISGNGQAILEGLFHEPATWQVLVALLAAKMAMTWLALSSGATGGVLTPSLAIGGLIGALLALGAQALQPHLLIGVAAMTLPAAAAIGAVGVLAITQRAPFFAIAFGLELIHAPIELILPTLAVGLGVYAMTRRIR